MKKSEHFGKRWTQEEYDFLEENYGRMSIAAIAKKLGRTEQAIKTKRERLSLYNVHETRGYMTMNQFHLSANVDHKVSKRWITNCNFPVRRMPGVKKLYVDPVAFWEWAEKHKDIVLFSRIERQTILPEPDWVEEERTKEIKTNLAKAPWKRWTGEEKSRAYHMFFVKGMTQREIAEELGRTIPSVEKKIQKMRKEKILQAAG